jgi:hypothetical protein
MVTVRLTSGGQLPIRLTNHVWFGSRNIGPGTDRRQRLIDDLDAWRLLCV